MARTSHLSAAGAEVQIALGGGAQLAGLLESPERPAGLVLFAHGSGSGRHSARNQRVAEGLRASGLATLLFDLLTPTEDGGDGRDPSSPRFDIPLLAERLLLANEWARAFPETRGLPMGYFGASTGAAAALVAAARAPGKVRALVSRGGRPDLASSHLDRVEVPTLLIVGANDEGVLACNQNAWRRLRAPSQLEIVPHAGHLFEEPGALSRVTALAASWFSHYLPEGGTTA